MDEKRYDVELVLIVWDRAQPPAPNRVPPHTSYRMEDLTPRQVHDLRNLATVTWGQMELDVRQRYQRHASVDGTM